MRPEGDEGEPEFEQDFEGEEEEKDEEPVEEEVIHRPLSDIPTDESKTLQEMCVNTDIVSDEKLDTSKGLTAILVGTPPHIIAHCYPYEQLLRIFKSKNPVYMWEGNEDSGHPILEEPVFKLPHSGLWIDSRGYINVRIYNTLMLQKVGDHRIGSQRAVSQLHGRMETIYTLIPISLSVYQ